MSEKGVFIMKEKLNGNDLINVGIFSAIYFVIVFITAMLGEEMS